MSRFVFVSLLLLAGAGISAAAQAQASQPAVSDHAAATAAHPSSGPKPGDRNCIRDTGSLIPPKKGECLPVAGRSYSQQDIQRTGQTTLGPALRDLDPSISVRGR
jgi:hypothetical protein